MALPPSIGLARSTHTYQDPSVRRLLALDIDGTLLRDDGTIAAEDMAAIARARAGGAMVTLVTGRIAAGALDVAREIAADVPIVCGDGAQIVDPVRGTLLEHESVERDAVSRALSVFAAQKLVPFALTHEAIHACLEAESYAPWVTGWAPELHLHPEWPELDTVAMLLGLGARELTHRTAVELAALSSSFVATFSIGELGAVRVTSERATKGNGLRTLAERLGVERANIAYAGDWYNDLSAFEWAGRSFCMGQAPVEVRAHASEVLRATSERGGGIAELVARWL